MFDKKEHGIVFKPLETILIGLYKSCKCMRDKENTRGSSKLRNILFKFEMCLVLLLIYLHNADITRKVNENYQILSQLFSFALFFNISGERSYCLKEKLLDIKRCQINTVIYQPCLFICHTIFPALILRFMQFPSEYLGKLSHYISLQKRY